MKEIKSTNMNIVDVVKRYGINNVLVQLKIEGPILENGTFVDIDKLVFCYIDTSYWKIADNHKLSFRTVDDECVWTYYITDFNKMCNEITEFKVFVSDITNDVKLVDIVKQYGVEHIIFRIAQHIGIKIHSNNFLTDTIPLFYTINEKKYQIKNNYKVEFQALGTMDKLEFYISDFDSRNNSCIDITIFDTVTN